MAKFVKGQIPWNKGKKYKNPKIAIANKGKHYSLKTEIKKSQHLSLKTEFKKGHISWDKGKKLFHLRGENAAHWKGGLPKCLNCKKELPTYSSKRWCRECYSKITRGKNHPSWKGGKPRCIDCGKLLSLYSCVRCRECEDKNRCGSNSYLWQGGISFEPYGLEFNNKLREQIRKRDNYICQECGYKQNKLGYKLHIHHIDYNKQNNKPENLISLCRLCHIQTNFTREDWIEYFQRRWLP